MRGVDYPPVRRNTMGTALTAKWVAQISHHSQDFLRSDVNFINPKVLDLSLASVLLDEINYEASSAAYLPFLYYALFLLHDLAFPIVKCYANLVCHQFLHIGNPECQNYAKRRKGNSGEEYSIESL